MYIIYIFSTSILIIYSHRGLVLRFTFLNKHYAGQNCLSPNDVACRVAGDVVTFAAVR